MPHSENVFRSVHITIMHCTAIRTLPFSYSKACDTFRPRVRQAAATRTCLGGESFVYFLIPRAREILAALPKDKPTCFDVRSGTRDALWRGAAKRAQIEDLHFHDSRAEAIWRLSKKLDVLELARVIGHRDLKSLMIYYQADADELADKL